MKIQNKKERKMVEVRNLKNLRFDKFPKEKFFLHQTLGAAGYTVSEVDSGAAITWSERTTVAAITNVENILSKISVPAFKKAKARAVQLRREIENESTK